MSCVGRRLRRQCLCVARDCSQWEDSLCSSCTVCHMSLLGTWASTPVLPSNGLSSRCCQTLFASQKATYFQHSVLQYLWPEADGPWSKKGIILGNRVSFSPLKKVSPPHTENWILAEFMWIFVSKGSLVSVETLQMYCPIVCGHPFKIVDLAISATSVADSCIKLSTTPCKRHRQILAVEWPYWRAQWL